MEKKQCTECQFEEGEHSQACSQYKKMMFEFEKFNSPTPNPEKEEKKCEVCGDNYRNDGTVCGCDYKSSTQEPMEEKKGCEKEIEVKFGTLLGTSETCKTKCGWWCDGEQRFCKDCSTIPTQEPMEWERAWEKLEVTYRQHNGGFTEPLMIDTEQEETIKEFIQSQIKQAEERHNLDCTREEWARESERAKITKEIEKYINPPSHSPRYKLFISKSKDYSDGYNEGREEGLKDIINLITNQ